MRSFVGRRAEAALGCAVCAVCTAFAPACTTGTTEPPFSGTVALVRSADGDPSLVMDVWSGRVVARVPTGLGIFSVEQAARGAGGDTIAFTGGGVLVGFDLLTRSVAWSELLGAPATARFDGQLIWGASALAWDRAGTHLLIADSEVGGACGIARLNASTRDAVGFIGPYSAVALAPVPPGLLADSVDLVAFGTTQAAGCASSPARRQGRIHLLSSVAAAVVDSISVLSSQDSVAGGVGAVAFSRSGRHVYLMTYAGNVRKVDLVQRQVVASVQLPTFGPIALSDAGDHLAVIDGDHDRDDPGTGTLFLIDSGLTEVRTIPLTAARYQGIEPVLQAVVFDPDSGVVHIGAGTARLGPLFGVQRGRIITVEVATGSIRRIRDVDSWGIISILFR